MDNYQNIYQNTENSTNDVGVTSKIELQFKPDDFYNYGATDDDGFHYTLAMHKSARLLLFAKIAENMTESQMGGHCIWVDANSNGRYQILDQDHAAEIKLIPTDFVRGKYNHAMYYFSICEDIKNKLCADKPEASEEQKLQELKSEIDLHLIRLVNLLIHDMANIEHITETTDNKLSFAIRNIVDNNNKFIPDLMKDDDDDGWLHLKFNSNSYYYFDEIDSLQENDSTLYYMAIHKTLKHAIFMKAAGPEFKYKTAAVHHLYISEDDGLGRYKVQTKEGEISKQFFVPIDYVAYRYNRFREFMDEFKKVQLQTTSDVYTRQTNWCKLQDDAIHLMNYTLGELERDLKQRIDKCLDHNMILASFMPNVNNFEDFYNKVVDTEKKIRLETIENTYSVRLVLFSLHNKMSSIIPLFKFEFDAFLPDEKVRILVSKYDADYYVLVGEAWMPKNLEIQKRIAVKYRNGNIAKLPRHKKREILTFIAKTKNSSTQQPDKCEVYEIIRENQNDEASRILKLKKFDNGGVEGCMEYPGFIGIEV